MRTRKNRLWTGPVDLTAIRERLLFDVEEFEFTSPSTPAGFVVSAYYKDYSSGKEEEIGVGRIEAVKEEKSDYLSVVDAYIDPEFRNQGIYPEILKAVRDAGKKYGYKGVVSRGDGRTNPGPTRSWRKFAARDPRVRKAGKDFFLEGLSKAGRGSTGKRLGAFTSNADLDKFKFRITKKQDGHVLRVYDGKALIGTVGAITKYCDLPGYESHGNVVSAEILPEYRGKKLYQEMLLRLRARLKEMGCKGLKSQGFQRSAMADRAWRKLTPRVESDKLRPNESRSDVLYLDGLPGVFTPGSRGIDLFIRETPGGRKFELTHNGEDIAYAYAVPNTVEVDGKKINTLVMQKIEVEEPWRRQGVSTYLMERMAWNAEGEGRALQSDWIRSAEHDPFWQKQLKKGRIAHTLVMPGGKTSYLLPLPAPDSLAGLPKKGRIPLAGLGKIIHDDSSKPMMLWRVQDAAGRGPYEVKSGRPGHRREVDEVVFKKLTEKERRDYFNESARKKRPLPEDDFIEWAALSASDRGGMQYGFLREDDAVKWFGPHGLSVLEQAGFRLTQVPASKAYLSKSKKQVLYVPAEALPLGSLPKKGRIPLATVKRVMKKMPRKVSSCKITPAALREGMQVELEHRNVTRGGVLMTAKIAASHLCEDTRYYKKLKKYVE